MQLALCAYLCVLGCLCVPSQQLLCAVYQWGCLCSWCARAEEVLAVRRVLCVGGAGQWGWCACPDSSALFLVHAELPVTVSPSLMGSHVGIEGQGVVFAQQNPNEIGTS